MTEEQGSAAEELEHSITKLEQSTTQLQSVLDVLFEAFASKGIKPSYHLDQALTSLYNNLSKAQSASKHTLEQLWQLRELVRTSALITSSLELDRVVEEVLDTITYLTGAERTYLMLYDENKKLQTYAARNWDRESLDKSEIEFSRSIIDAAIEDRMPILTTNAQTDERFGGKQSIVFQKLRSILCIPLLLGGQIVGVLYSDNRYQQDLFEQDIIPVLTAFGTQAAIAIKNAQIFGEVKEDLEEAQRVIQQLRIEIDRGRVDEEVSEITDTEYFRNLANMAEDLRRQYDEAKKKKKRLSGDG
jgi:two-component system NtrC family sensor kinase